ncbi:MAG: hypothetical protein ABIX37_08045 [Gammaproteobacteria bacterium]
MFRYLSSVVVLALLAVLLTGPQVLAAGPPSFAGTWVLNTKKGENLGMVSAITETVVITQTPAAMTLDVSSTFMGKTTVRQVNYDLDGKPVQNESAMGDKAETTAKWSGGKLSVVWLGEGAVAGSTTEKTESRELSADGKTMTVTSARGTKPAMVMVYERQE